MIDQVTAVEPSTDLRESANPPTNTPISPKNFCKILSDFAVSSVLIGCGVFLKCAVTRDIDPAKNQCYSDEMPIGFALGYSALGIIKAGAFLAEEIDRRCFRRPTIDEINELIIGIRRTELPTGGDQTQTQGNLIEVLGGDQPQTQRISIEVSGGEVEGDNIGIVIIPHTRQVTGQLGFTSGSPSSASSEPIQWRSPSSPRIDV